jgi:hypothetical protein
MIANNGKKLKKLIHTLRSTQVILDRDLAKLYQVQTRVLKQAVNRNKKKFPSDFLYKLTSEEIGFMVSQNVIPSKKHLGGALPYAFTEQGISMLSSVLNSEKAIEINIQIMRAFVSMRKFISNNVKIFMRLDSIDKKNIKYDKKFEKIFDAIDDDKIKQGIFFEGQVFDAYKFVLSIIKSANKSIILIDNYIDENVLILFSERNKNVQVKILTKNISEKLNLDIKKFNSQYEQIEVMTFNKSHDRFLIIDNKEVYHIGASLKDLGKKWFAFSKFDKQAVLMIDEINKNKNLNN